MLQNPLRMGRRRSLAGACLVLALTATGVSAASADTGTASDATAATSQSPITLKTYEWAKVLRGDLGLPSSDSFLELVAHTPGVNVDKYGIPLLPTEVAEIDRRQGLLPYISKLRDALPADVFGGGWVDHHAGGLLTIAVVGDTSAITSQVFALLPPEIAANVKIISVSVSEKRLSDIVSELGVNSPQEWGVTSAESHTQDSQVEIEVPTSAPTNIENIVREKYGDLVVVKRSDSPAAPAVNRVSSTLPLYGGQRISTRVLNTPTSYLKCTVGYSNVRDNNGQFLTLTAGHCGDNASEFAQGEIGGRSRYIGKAQRDRVYDGAVTNCDCLVIGPIPGGSGTESWQLNDNTLERITGTAAAATNESTVVCHSGATTMQEEVDKERGNAVGKGVVQCGVVISRDSYKQLTTDTTRGVKESYELRYGNTVKMTCLGGDSGGTVGNNRKIYGIVSWANSQAYNADARCGYSTISFVGESGLTLGF